MATKTLTTRIILRNDTANNWTTNNPVLLKGEIGLETDTGKYKIGDGTSNWQALSYYVNLDQDSKTSLDTLIEMLNDEDFGNVNDVQVNGTTVVENKVASISIGVLTTSATTQSEVTVGESFTGNIVLHKVAKTGNFGDLNNVPQASNAQAGIIQMATDTEAEAGAVETKAVNPKQLKTAIDGLGNVFDLKGSVQSVSNLPSTGNAIGDVWYVIDESVGYVWLNDGTTDRWEQLGLPINLSNYVQFSDITNSLTSTETDKALSASAGRSLNNSINAIINNIINIANTDGGVSAGQDALASDSGGAIGAYAQATTGGAVGSYANSNNGGAVGSYANANNGGAVGMSANTGNGFAGGHNAKAQDAEGNGIDAIQLGAGTNTEVESLQVYDYKLMTASGKVPDERLNDTVLLSTDTLVLDGGTSTIATA